MNNNMKSFFLSCLVILSGLLSLFAQDPVPKGDRTLAIDVNYASDGDYGIAFAMAQELGIQEVKLSLDWNGIETEQGFDYSLIDIINWFYPEYNMPVSLIFRPVNTNMLTLPSDIASLPLDDEQVISRFKAFLDSIYNRIPDLTVTAVFIGNEIGAYLGNDVSRWNAFSTFYDSARAHVKSLWGSGMKVGTIGMLYDMIGEPNKGRYQGINENSDVIGVTYYPLNGDFSVKDPSVVQADFDDIVAAFPDIPLWFTEAGYPTGAACNSTEEKQADFITQVFQAWDRHKDNIAHIDFTWMHDQDSATVASWIIAYGMAGSPYADAFGAYLATLGMRTYDGQDKTGYKRLIQEAALRGWNDAVSINRLGRDAQHNASLQMLYRNHFPSVAFRVFTRSAIQLDIINIREQVVKQLTHGIHNPGSYEILWDGRDYAGCMVPHGLYVLRLISETQESKYLAFFHNYVRSSGM
jgi:hypothetical protein